MPEVKIDSEMKRREDYQANLSIIMEDLAHQIQSNPSKATEIFENIETESDETKLSTLESFKGLVELMNNLSIEQKQNLDQLQHKVRESIDSNFMMMQNILEEDSSTKVQTEDTSWRENTLLELRIESSELDILDVILGQGRFGKVQLGRWRGKTVAVKSLVWKHSLPFNPGLIPEVENEMLLMKYLGNHKSVIQLYGYSMFPETINIVLELAVFGALSMVLFEKHIIPEIPVSLLLAWFCDMADVISYIHSKRVKHKDLKAENFLVFDMFHIKLCDFGLSKRHQTQCSSTLGGTLAFMAPEVKEGEGSTFVSDIYSFAMTVVQLITRQFPKVGKQSEQIQNAVGMFDMQQRALLLEMLLSCVSSDPNDRPIAKNVHQRCLEILKYNGGDPRLNQSESFQRICKLNTQMQTQRLLELETVATGIVEQSKNSQSNSSQNTNKSDDSKEPIFPMHNIAGLNQELAVELLIYLGCIDSLHEIIAEKSEYVDGDVLTVIDINTLKDLEGAPSQTRILKLQTILRKLQQMVLEGISQTMMNNLSNSYAKRQRQKNSKSEVSPLGKYVWLSFILFIISLNAKIIVYLRNLSNKLCHFAGLTEPLLSHREPATTNTEYSSAEDVEKQG
jgi:serine/threonine protein kinase